MISESPLLIPLTNGMFATVDRRDYERVAARRWTMQLSNYGHPQAREQLPYSAEHRDKRGHYGEYLHRFILGLTNPNERVRFRNSNKLDCRRENMYVIWHTNRCKNPKRRGPAELPNPGQDSFPVPCGEIRPAKVMTRCAGFRPEGDQDGCPHYDSCMDIAAKQLWDGFTGTCGEQNVREWKYVDDLWEFLVDYGRRQRAGR